MLGSAAFIQLRLSKLDRTNYQTLPHGSLYGFAPRNSQEWEFLTDAVGLWHILHLALRTFVANHIIEDCI